MVHCEEEGTGKAHLGISRLFYLFCYLVSKSICVGHFETTCELGPKHFAHEGCASLKGYPGPESRSGKKETNFGLD